MSYWLHPLAAQELSDAAAYYEDKASKKLALLFLDEFERLMALLGQHPSLGRPDGPHLRRYALTGFPYSLIYRAQPHAKLEVFAIAHHRRKPSYWASRL